MEKLAEATLLTCPWIPFPFIPSRVSLVAQMVKSLHAMQETQVRSLGWEIPWRRKWQPPPVFLSGKSHGQRSLAGYSSWGYKESDTTERLTLSPPQEHSFCNSSTHSIVNFPSLLDHFHQYTSFLEFLLCIKKNKPS